MSATTGPIIAGAAIVVGNAVLVHQKHPLSQGPVYIGAAIAAGGLALWERAMPQTATAVAWLVLLSVLVVRVDSNTPAPIESIARWINI